MIEPLSALVAAACLVLIAVKHRDDRLVAGILVVAAACSLAVTAHFAGKDDTGWAGATLLEMVTLSAPIALLLRARHPARSVVAACVFAGVAESALILRYTEPSLPASLPALALWSLPAVGAAGAGLYLRALDARRQRAVADARRGQRVSLARDLHDYVAHDITGVVVQAQAARTVADRDPARAGLALERIEAAGLRALGSIDRALALLREDADEASATPADAADVESIAELARRFGTDSDVDVELAIDPHVAALLDAEVAGTLHRVAAETLTNVRRHAPRARRVEVALSLDRREARPAVVLTVTNDGVSGDATPEQRNGGAGLDGLAERVTALTGRFDAGPRGADEWHVHAELPLAR